MVPKSLKKNNKLPLEPRWKRAEKNAQRVLKEKFGQKFKKDKIIVGKPREFDLVSSDKSIIVQVKSSKGFESQDSAQHRVRFAECMLDYILLEKADAKKKIFVIADKPLYDFFIKESIGLITDNVEVMLIELKE